MTPSDSGREPAGQGPSPDRGQGTALSGPISASLLFEQPLEGAFNTRTTFFVEADWPAGSDKKTGKRTVGRMYVECLDPLMVVHGSPIILIHGDWHTGQVCLSRGLPRLKLSGVY